MDSQNGGNPSHDALRHAVRLKLIPFNPAADVAKRDRQKGKCCSSRNPRPDCFSPRRKDDDSTRYSRWRSDRACG